jgi:hypothetical protein
VLLGPTSSVVLVGGRLRVDDGFGSGFLELVGCGGLRVEVRRVVLVRWVLLVVGFGGVRLEVVVGRGGGVGVLVGMRTVVGG